MANISQGAENEIRKLLESWWLAVNQQLSAATGSAIQIGPAPLDMLLNAEIGQRLARIAEAAEGNCEWSEATARGIVDDCDAFESWLNQTPITHKTPEEFWNTPIGYMVLCARVWAEQDRLISLSEAAQESGMSLSVLSQRISRGQIMAYRDPREKNPQRARRIRLSDLHLLLHQGIIRKPFTTGFFHQPGDQDQHSHQPSPLPKIT